MRFGKTVCIIVDAYSTGKNLAPYLNGRGYQCIHIKSNPNLPSQYRHDPSNFIKNIVFQGDISAILAALEGLIIKICIPGSESGVELADVLSETLNITTNGTLCSRARRDKYVMTELVAKNGLKTIKHIQSNDLQKIIDWSKEQTEFPIVLKPLDSASGDGVFFCHTEDEIKSAFTHIIKTPNIFGQENQVVLAQTFNPGQEYIVNSVSCNGRHFVTEIWKITKVSNTTIYDTAELINRRAKEFSHLEAYTRQTLNALQIQHGASTTELKYTLEGGPILIETGARLMGNAPLSFSNDLAGFTQLSLMIEAYLNPDMFMHIIDSYYQPKMFFDGLIVALISDSEGTLAHKFDTKEIEQLSSFHSYVIDGEPGTTIQKTTSSINSPGEVYLLNKDKKQLLADYEAIRRIEKEGLYSKATTKESIMLAYQGIGVFTVPREVSLPSIPKNSISNTMLHIERNANL